MRIFVTPSAGGSRVPVDSVAGEDVGTVADRAARSLGVQPATGWCFRSAGAILPRSARLFATGVVDGQTVRLERAHG